MAAKIKKEETLRVAWECRAQRLKQMGKIDKATFRYYHADNRTDLDNAEFYQKYIWDGLVEAMVIPDDNNHYQPKERSHIHYEDKKNPRIEIEFEYEE